MFVIRRFANLAFGPVPFKMHAKKTFKSFVFFDLETTGLQRPVEITELCFIGVSKDQLLSSSKLKALNTKTVSMPRMLDKMTICVRPSQEIEPGAQMITNLSNSKLQNSKGFDSELARSIKSYLLRQQSPCCLVAHGGDRYDFDILVTEFSGAGLEFPSSVLVSDSCSAFRALHKDLRNSERNDDWRGLSRGRISHSLGNLFKRYTGKDIEGSHTAEGDTLALLELVLSKPELLEYLEKGTHIVGNGGQNPGLAAIKERNESENCTQNTEEEEKEVLDEYFSILEQEGVMKK